MKHFFGILWHIIKENRGIFYTIILYIVTYILVFLLVTPMFSEAVEELENPPYSKDDLIFY